MAGAAALRRSGKLRSARTHVVQPYRTPYVPGWRSRQWSEPSPHTPVTTMHREDAIRDGHPKTRAGCAVRTSLCRRLTGDRAHGWPALAS